MTNKQLIDNTLPLYRRFPSEIYLLDAVVEIHTDYGIFIVWGNEVMVDYVGCGWSTFISLN